MFHPAMEPSSTDEIFSPYMDSADKATDSTPASLSAESNESNLAR